MSALTSTERARNSYHYRRRLERVLERAEAHKLRIEAGPPSEFVPRHLVLTVLDDVLAAARGELV